ncbi:MAG: hypothetical protein IPJ14_21960 [Kineosporiaceae bacterium]|nr:hypothetical protein [Kineosporiaceae bacterium]
MAHPTRGSRSAAYEILEVTNVDFEALSITVRYAGAYQPERATLHVKPTAAARQVLRAMAASIKVSPTAVPSAGWESLQTLRSGIRQATVVLRTAAELGFDDLTDPRIGIAELRAFYDPLVGSLKRSSAHLLATAVAVERPDGKALAYALKNSRFIVDDRQARVYDEDVVDAVERCARRVWLDRYESQRQLLAQLGYDVNGRGWLRVPAEELLDWACRIHPQLCEPTAKPPRLRATADACAAWALTHPQAFGLGARTVLPRAVARVGQALYPDNVTITAALILHCLGENSGYNYAVLLEKSTTSLVYLGPDHALETSVKARNRTQDTRVTDRSSIFSPGGLMEVLAGLTRVSRHYRSHLRTSSGDPHPLTQRLYVEHYAKPDRTEQLSPNRLHNAWRAIAFDEHWDGPGERREVPLWTTALRLAALNRALGEGLRADVHGHTPRTKVHYMAHVLPDHVLTAHAAAAQAALHEDNVKTFIPITAATDGVAADLAHVPAEDVMDVEIGVCTSAGQDPEDRSRRCGLGITACFTCPNGFRTVDHIPGLLAAVELADIIARNDPVEYEDGEASRLGFYAQAALDRFSPLVVANVRRSTDLVPHILTVTGMYMEMRHG